MFKCYHNIEYVKSIPPYLMMVNVPLYLLNFYFNYTWTKKKEVNIIFHLFPGLYWQRGGNAALWQSRCGGWHTFGSRVRSALY